MNFEIKTDRSKSHLRLKLDEYVSLLGLFRLSQQHTRIQREYFRLLSLANNPLQAMTSDEREVLAQQVLAFLNWLDSSCPVEYPARRWKVTLRNSLLENLSPFRNDPASWKDSIVSQILAHPSVFAYRGGRFSKDLFTQHEGNWQSWLKPLMNGGRRKVLEIGSFEGMSALWTLDCLLENESSELVCIDTFGGDFHKTFAHNIQSHSRGERVETIVGKSRIAMKSLANNYFDFIYVDGSHQEPDVASDANQAWGLLAPGGILIFDDYYLYDSKSQTWPVRRALDQFLDRQSGKFKLIQTGFQLVIQKSRSRPK